MSDMKRRGFLGSLLGFFGVAAVKPEPKGHLVIGHECFSLKKLETRPCLWCQAVATEIICPECMSGKLIADADLLAIVRPAADDVDIADCGKPNSEPSGGEFVATGPPDENGRCPGYYQTFDVFPNGRPRFVVPLIVRWNGDAGKWEKAESL